MEEAQERPPPETQVTFAENARVARRDYIENLHVRKAAEILKLMSQRELDELAIVSERVFEWRFGFDAEPDECRQVLDIKARSGLTDKKIWWLKQTGNLRCDDGIVRLAPSRTMEWAGWAQIAVISLYFVMALLALWAGKSTSTTMVLAQIGFAAFTLALVILYHRVYVKPSRIARRALRRMSTDQDSATD